jgi:hypothetical protein
VLPTNPAERTVPRSTPEEAGPRIVFALFTEFMPSVQRDYELLEKAKGGPLKVGLLDLQIEVLIFALHCLDRAVFAHYGAEYRAAFMDSALSAIPQAFTALVPEPTREGFWEHVRDRFNTRQREYARLILFPENEAPLKGTLFWEFAKSVCLDAGVTNPVMLKGMLEEGLDIFTMMDQIALTL